MLSACAGGSEAPTAEPAPTETPPVAEETLPAVETGPQGVPCDLPLPAPANWEVVLCETFEGDPGSWQVETQDNPYAAYTSEIVDGAFRVDYTAKGFAAFQQSALTWFDVAKQRDFALSVTGAIDTTFDNAYWGVSFRGNGEDFFLFTLTNTGEYLFEIFENNVWTPIITQRTASAIRMGEPNTLRIEAVGQDFYFTVNDVLVNDFRGATLAGEDIQIVVSAKEGVSAVFTFDDVVVQR